MADTEYLDEERKKTWKRIEALEESLPIIQKLAEETKKIAESKISVTEADAKKAFDNAMHLIQEASQEKNEAIQLLNEIKKITKNYTENKIILQHAVEAANEVQEAANNVKAKTEELLKIEESITNIQSSISLSQKETSSDLSIANKTMESIVNIENEASSSLKKILELQLKASDKKSDIDGLYDEIMGYTKENGEQEEGLKKELEDSYNLLKNQYTILRENFSIFSKENKEKLDKFLKNAYDSKDAVIKEIRSYLPDSVTAGLAGAFNKKKEEENNERNVTSKRFSHLIWGMFGVALLPFMVYVVWLFQGKGLEEVIQKIPNMTIAVLPLYIPLIWLGVHFNRRINLSKKLIEEYAYKEAVCKSFAGLSEQIESINDKKTLQELRLKLIDLVMSVNSENPGKYITQYDKCDNPAVELLARLEKMNYLNIKAKGMKCEVQIDKENTSSEQRENNDKN